MKTRAFPGTQRIAVDRKAAAQGKPPILLIEQDKRASRVQIKCSCCGDTVAEVRWSGNTTDAPAVWIEVPLGSPMKVFTDTGDR